MSGSAEFTFRVKVETSGDEAQITEVTPVLDYQEPGVWLGEEPDGPASPAQSLLFDDLQPVKPAKPKRKRKVKLENIDGDSLVVKKAPKARKRKDKTIRTLFREKLATLDLSTLKKPWMASKSFRLVDTDADLKNWVDEVLADPSRWLAPYKGTEPVPCVAVDTETIGLDTRVLVDIQEARNPDGSLRLDAMGNVIWEATYEVKIEIAGVCLSVDGVSGLYIPINHESCSNVSREAAQFHLQRLFNVAHLIFYNAKFDREVMRHTLGIIFRDYPHFEDVQALHFSNDPKAKEADDTFSGDAHGLKGLSSTKLGFEQIDLSHIGKVQAEWCPVTSSPHCTCSEELRRERKHTLRMQYVPFTWIPTSLALWYAAADAICTWLLWFQMKDEAQSRVRVHKIDGEQIDSLTWIERQRFLIAEDPHRRMSQWHMRQMAERREHLRQIAVRMGWQELTDDDGNIIADTRFNVDKKHLPKFLFETLRLEVVKRTAKGAPSTDKEAMVDLLKKYPNHEFLTALDAYKKYVALHPENLKFDPKDKTARIYLKQSVVAGGRLAASGGQFDRDGGIGLNIQAVKKVGGNWYVKGRVLDPDYVHAEDVEPREESDLHPSCFKDVEENVVIGWKQTERDGSITTHTEQFPEDIHETVIDEDPTRDVRPRPKYTDDAPERLRQPVYEKRKVKRQAQGIIGNHIANFLGYAICLVPSCKTCATKFGVLIEKGRLDANQILNLRALFVAPKGWTLFSSDYSNIEMRCAANISGEPKFIDEFLVGAGDFHSLTAAACFPEFTDPNSSAAVRKSCRDLAKIINFALLYGGTEYTILENMRKKKPDITMADCKAMVAAYWTSVPVFKAFCDEKQRQAREEMRCFTATGRVVKFDSAMAEEGIRVPKPEEWDQYWAYTRVRKAHREAEARGDIEDALHLKDVMDRAWRDPATGVRNCSDYNRFMSKIQRVAVNVPLQGLAGDFMRMAINRVRKWATLGEFFVQSVFRLHCSVHDELDYTVKNEYIPFVVPRVTRLMKLRKLHELRKWPVPIECDTEFGGSWDVQFHLTGDADHIPSGWTDIEGLEEYLPEEFDLDTVTHLTRAILSGKETARARTDAWAKESLHPRAYGAFGHALWTKNKEKKTVPQTEETVIRKQVIAALQLHEYWTIDTVPDDDGATMERLEQYERRRGLTVADRGFMPDGGYLGTLPTERLRRPVLEPLVVPGTEAGAQPIEIGTRPLTQPVAVAPLPDCCPDASCPHCAGAKPEESEGKDSTPAPSLRFRESASIPAMVAPPPVRKELDASEMADDNLLDELLGKGLSRPSVKAPATEQAPEPANRMQRWSAPPPPEAPSLEGLPVLRDFVSEDEIKALRRALMVDLGTNRIECVYAGQRWVFADCIAAAIPPEFLKEPVYG